MQSRTCTQVQYLDGECTNVRKSGRNWLQFHDCAYVMHSNAFSRVVLKRRSLPIMVKAYVVERLHNKKGAEDPKFYASNRQLRKTCQNFEFNEGFGSVI